MVYCKTWEEFITSAQIVLDRSPEITRYCIRWQHEKGFLVLKVTDNHQCIKFKTRSTIYLNRFDQFTQSIVYSQQATIKERLLLQPPPTNASIPLTTTTISVVESTPKKKKGKKKK